MSDLVTDLRGTTMWITIERAEVGNAMSRSTSAELVDLAEELDQRRNDVHAIVITGAGGEMFCAGADPVERRGVGPDEMGQFLSMMSAGVNAWGAIRKPTIAAINGSAFGGGLELALACDVRIAVEGAELGLTEVREGTMPCAGGTLRLPRLVGEARAKEMILFGRRLSAARALEIGLVNQVTTRAQLGAAVDALLAELAACAPIAVRVAKAAIEYGHGRPLDDGLAFEAERAERTLHSEDWDEARAAEAEGRAPRFRGA